MSTDRNRFVLNRFTLCVFNSKPSIGRMKKYQRWRQGIIAAWAVTQIANFMLVFSLLGHMLLAASHTNYPWWNRHYHSHRTPHCCQATSRYRQSSSNGRTSCGILNDLICLDQDPGTSNPKERTFVAYHSTYQVRTGDLLVLYTGMFDGSTAPAIWGRC